MDGVTIPEFTNSNFFVLRTPLLPVEDLLAWSESLAAAHVKSGPEALEQAWRLDVQILRNRLRVIIDRPEVLHALYVASPSLQAGIEHWKRDPESRKGLQAERALVRYFTRMVIRPTPFGLFSGCSIGRLQETDRTSEMVLKSQSHYRICCRLDFDYLFALTAALQRDPSLAAELRYWPNSSLHRVADAWHYIESRWEGSKRTHHLVKVESDPYLEAVLDRAQVGARVPELVEAVLRQPGEANPSEEDAREYVLQLIHDNNLLVSSLSPLLTGASPLDDIIQQVEVLPSGAQPAHSLRAIRNRLTLLEGKGLRGTVADYEAVTREVEKLPAHFDRGRLYQVDMIKPVEQAILGKAVVAELTKAVQILHKLGQSGEFDELKSFRNAFTARYERAMIPLMEALDEEVGIGFGKIKGTDPSPLLRGLGLHQDMDEERWINKQLDVHPLFLQKVFECARTGKCELDLGISDLPMEENPQELPDSFCVMASLAAASPDALQRGDFEIYLREAVGPSGARLLGRFCHADPELRAHVQNYLRQEEAHDSEAIFAEVVYLPEGRIGNVLCRPLLRHYEIPYLGRSGARQNRQLQVSDLLVGVEAGSIVLRSRRLGRRVIPRLTNAHGFMDPKLSSVYRFLCCLQHQHRASVPGFSWGFADTLDFLPKVRVGRVVLSLAQWRLAPQEVEALGKTEKSRRFIAAQQLRRQRGLPRWVVLQEGDNSLPVDLDNALSVDAFIHVLKRGTHAVLTELYPPPDKLCVCSSEGHFYHELNVPFVRSLQVPAKNEVARAEAQKSPALMSTNISRETRVLPPGGEWLYLKLYGGAAILDEILTAAVLPLVRDTCASGSVVRWFFVRYTDPHENLRIRFNGPSARLVHEVLPLACQAFNPLLSAGKIWRIELDTYQREIERYGGVEAMDAAEDIFFADSEAVLAILSALAGDGGDIRWRIGILGIDRLLSDFGLDEESKRNAAVHWRDHLEREFKADAILRKKLSERFRVERHTLESLLQLSIESDRTWVFANHVFGSRSVPIASAIQRLRGLAVQGKLAADLGDLAVTYAHVHINRLIRSSQRAHEFVLYDFLVQLYESRIARTKRTSSKLGGL